MYSQNLHAFLTQPDGIASLMPQARRLLELRTILATVLPESLSRSCSVANYKQGKIVIFAANSAVAAKLKLMRPALSEQLSKRGVQVTGIEVEVQPPGPTPEVIEKSAKISHDVAESLARLSTQLPDSELKNALIRLARQKCD
ncbi:MAG: DciA family protein [Burkholderiales bacterium]